MARTRIGLTLVEVLIAVGIIMVLAAIISFAIRSAADRAKSAACMNNLRQLHTALHLYAGSADDRLPPAMGRNSSGIQIDFAVFKDGLAAFGAEPELWRCPSDQHQQASRVTLDSFYSPVSFTETSYGIDLEPYEILLGDAGNAHIGPFATKPLSSLRAEHPLMFERSWGREGRETPESQVTAHGRAVHVLYVSGSAKRVPMSEWTYIP